MASSLFNNQTNQNLQTTSRQQQINEILQLAKNKNMTVKDLFYEKAKEMGVNPDTILNQLK